MNLKDISFIKDILNPYIIPDIINIIIYDYYLPKHFNPYNKKRIPKKIQLSLHDHYLESIHVSNEVSVNEILPFFVDDDNDSYLVVKDIYYWNIVATEIPEDDGTDNIKYKNECTIIGCFNKKIFFKYFSDTTDVYYLTFPFIADVKLHTSKNLSTLLTDDIKDTDNIVKINRISKDTDI
jgi:hypothetical protein